VHASNKQGIRSFEARDPILSIPGSASPLGCGHVDIIGQAKLADLDENYWSFWSCLAHVYWWTRYAKINIRKNQRSRWIAAPEDYCQRPQPVYKHILDRYSTSAPLLPFVENSIYNSTCA